MSLPEKSVEQLKAFITVVKSFPGILHKPELSFFKEFIESFGGTVPVVPQETSETPKEETPPAAAAGDTAVQDEESDVELDTTGIIEGDLLSSDEDAGLDTSSPASEEDMEKANDKKMEAIGAFNEGDYEKAIKLYTDAMKLNPGQALLFAKRGQCYLKLQKPNACIRDCTIALSLNPDCAAAYKFRGRAYRLLGQWLDAASDLRNACKIDFDQQADEWLKEVTPNARKLEEHQRKYERIRMEKLLAEKKERLRKAREGATTSTSSSTADEVPTSGSASGAGDGLPPNIPDGIKDILADPEIREAFKDPSMVAAFNDILANPLNIQKHMGNPKVAALIQKIYSKPGVANMGSAFGGGFPPSAGGDAGAGGLFG